MFRKIFYHYSERSRKEKVKLFFKLLTPLPDDGLLDAGGGEGTGFREIWNYFNKVVVIDLDRCTMKKVRRELPKIEVIVGDVCNIPLKDKSVDFVFSNAVIEHIDKGKRYLFAKEIKRVSRKGYFITTPNYWFPFEPHYMCPFWQYFPERFKKIFKRYFRIGHFKKGLYKRIDLLTKSELASLFPEGSIYGLKITFMPETLICYYKV